MCVCVCVCVYIYIYVTIHTDDSKNVQKIKIFTNGKFNAMLTHFWPTFQIYSPWKHQKNQRFSSDFKGYKMGTLTRNGLSMKFEWNVFNKRNQVEAKKKQWKLFNPLSANPTKCSNILHTCVSVFDHLVGLALKGLK